jgi:hypothetical protein
MLRALSSPGVEPPALSDGVWETALRHERCAAPLKGLLAAQVGLAALPSEVTQALERFASREWQRILMARAQLLQIDRIALEHGLRIVVLKGGLAALADSGAVDLVDVDVLARSHEARVLADQLDEVGYAGVGFSSTQHLRSRARPGALLVEVHETVDFGDPVWSAETWERVVPVARTDGLLRLAPKDHLWHLLYHVGVVHPHRRGAIRDLLLTSSAIADCAESEVTELERRADVLPQRRAVRDLLGMARELASGGVIHDRFARLVIGSVVIRRSVRWLPLSGQPQASVGICATALISGWPDVKREWGRVRMRTIEGSANRPIAWFERLGPRIGRAVRVTVRAVRTTLALVLALPIAGLAALTSYRILRSRTP